MFISRICKNYMVDFIKTFIILISSLSLLLSVVGLVEKIDDFSPFKPTGNFFVKYIFYTLPRYIFYLMPFVTLFSALFIFSMGVRNREFLILSVAGARLRETLKPFMWVGIIITILGFLVGELIQPYYAKKINNMVSQLTEKAEFSLKNNIYLKGKDQTIINIGSFDQAKNFGKNIRLYQLKDYTLIKTIESKEFEVKDNLWIFKDVTIYDFISGKIERLPSMSYPVNFKISLAAYKDLKKIEDFSLGELIKRRKELKNVGLSNPKIDTDISGKLSYNLVTLIMLFLGISLPLGAYEKFSPIISKMKISSGSSYVITIGIGLIITILYWLVYSLFMFVGYSKILPPFIAPWITPLMFGLISLKLFYSIKE